MERQSRNEGEQETRVPNQGSFLELFNRAGAQALVGFDFYFQEQGDYAPGKVRIEQVNPNGLTLKVMDLRAKKLIEREIAPGELTVGWATRAEDDPVIRLLRQVKIYVQPFLDPNLRVTRQEAEGVRVQQERRGEVHPYSRSATPVRPPGRGQPVHASRSDMGGRVRTATPSLRGHFSPSGRGEGMQRGRGAFGPFQPFVRGLRPIPVRPMQQFNRVDEENLRRERERFQAFEERREGEGSQVGDSGFQERRQWGPAEREFGDQRRRAAWHGREIPEDMIAQGGRAMRQRADERQDWYEEIGSPFAMSRGRRYREGGNQRENRAEGRRDGPAWQTVDERDERRAEIDDDWVEVRSEGPGGRFWGAD
jgi:hypothetical protein